MAEPKKKPKKAHADCRRNPCPYCKAGREADQAFTDAPDGEHDRFERGLPRGPYAG